MDKDKSVKNVTNYGLIIFIVFILAGIIGLAIWINIKKNQIQKNWPNYRCKPYIVPIAGIIGPEGTSAEENQNFCNTKMQDNAMNTKLKKYDEALTKNLSFQNLVNERINFFYLFINRIRNSIKNAVTDLQNKAYDIYYRIAYIFKLFLKVFVQIGITVVNLFNVLKYTFYMLASLWNGPVGGLFRFFCFDENTIINTNVNQEKLIKIVQIGDELEDGGKVFATFEFDSKDQEMYIFRNKVLVSGNHEVYVKDKFQKVKDTLYSSKVKYKRDKIYCLGTTTGKIKIKNILFKDYFDENVILELNKGLIALRVAFDLEKNDEIEFNPNYKWYEQLPCFYENSLVILDDGEKKPICSLSIGDKTEHGKVLGIVKFQDVKDCYEINDIIVQGNTPILQGNKVKLVKNLKNVRPVTQLGNYYNILTEGGLISVDEGIFGDFEPDSSLFPSNMS